MRRCWPADMGRAMAVGPALRDQAWDLSFAFADLRKRVVGDHLRDSVNVSSCLSLC
jgi:hypothetical protein